MLRHQTRIWVALAICAGLHLTGTPVQAQLANPCPFTNDGDCDEPNGLGNCAWGTDVADCANPSSNYGGGSGYSGGGGGGASYLLNPCPHRNDGDCDEPNGLALCDWGTDPEDCANPYSNYGGGSGYGTGPVPPAPPGGSVPTPGGTSYLLNPCPHLNDGDCDEPNGLGLCDWGTDVADCANPNSNFGGGAGYGYGSGNQGAGSGTPGTAQPGGARQFYALPTLNGMRVDECVSYAVFYHSSFCWADYSADLFCIEMGFTRAEGHRVIDDSSLIGTPFAHADKPSQPCTHCFRYLADVTCVR